MALRLEKGICGICPGNCGVEVVLQNDRITEIHPWKDHPQGVPCVRGRHAPEVVYSPDRLEAPLKRKGPKGTLEFEQITWDQALDEIARVILRLKSQYGPECIGSFFGRGNFEQSLWQMFTPREIGFSSGNSIFMPLGSPNAFSVGSLCFCSYGLLAPIATFGAPMGILEPDIAHAEIIFIWGTNPATDSPLSRMIALQAAKKRGAKIVVIDPLRTHTAKIADLWVPIQPGTDAALIHGILNLCFQNETVDREFGQEYCRGLGELEEYTQSFTPNTVERITRVPEETVAHLASLLASTRKVAFLAYTGLEYSNAGVQTIRALLTLWALTGHLDVEGGQRFQFPVPAPLRKPEVSFPTDVPPIGMDSYPYYCKMTRNGQFMEFPRSVLDEDPYKIRFLLIGGASVLTSFPNAPLFARSLAALDYQVSVDRFLNADALYADMVLPATTYFEATSFCGFPSPGPPRALQYRKKIIDPIGKSMSDYRIYAALAERLGYGHLYPQSEEEMVRYVIRDLTLFTFEDFKAKADCGPQSLSDGSFFQASPPGGEERRWMSGKLRKDGTPGFPTPSGKWEITSSILKDFGYSPFPSYQEVTEGPGNQELRRRYPLTLTTGTRIQSTFRSQHLNIPGLLKLQPAAEALLHPQDAGVRGIATGDRVKVRSPRGEVEFTARVTGDILTGVVEVNQGGGSPVQAEGWRERNVNLITDDQNRDPVSGFPVLKALLCEVEKVSVQKPGE